MIYYITVFINQHYESAFSKLELRKHLRKLADLNIIGKGAYYFVRLWIYDRRGNSDNQRINGSILVWRDYHRPSEFIYHIPWAACNIKCLVCNYIIRSYYLTGVKICNPHSEDVVRIDYSIIDKTYPYL